MASPPPPGSAVAYSPPPPNMMSSHSDLEGVGHLKVGAVIGLVVQAMFWIGFGIFYLIYSNLTNNVNAYGVGGTSTLPSWITVNTLYAAVGLLAAGLFIGIIGFIFFFLGFRAIKRGAPSFGAPSALMIVGLIGFLLAAVGVVVVVGTIVSAINNAVGGTVTAGSASLDISAILTGIALAGLGGLLALVGVIGLVLGNWRAGKRYNEGTLKIGAILTILPYVSIVGYILLLVGYMKAGNKLKSGWMPPNEMMMGQMPPPGYYAPPPPPGAPAPVG